MDSDPEIMYDGVLYHLPLYEDEIVKNVIEADKETEFHKKVDGYIIITNYRFVFMEKVKNLEYRFANFFYHKDIISVRLGGVVNRFVQVNGIIFHPMEISVEFIKSALQKLKEDASSQKFSYIHEPEEAPVPGPETFEKPLFLKSVNIVISIFCIVIGLFLILSSALWFYAGPHAVFPFVISLLGVIFSALILGLMQIDKYFEKSESLENSLKIMLGLSILGLVFNSVGLGLGHFHSWDLNLYSGRNSPAQLFTIVYFGAGVLLAFLIGIYFSKIPIDPKYPYEDLNNEYLEIFELEKYEQISLKFLLVYAVVMGAQILTLILFNSLETGNIYLVLSIRFSPFPDPSDIRLSSASPFYSIYSSIFLGTTIAAGVFGLVFSAYIQLRNVGLMRENIMEVLEIIKKKLESKDNYFKEVKIRIRNKTQRILQRMHAAVTDFMSPPSPPPVRDAETPMKSKVIETKTPSMNAQDEAVPIPITTSRQKVSEVPVTKTEQITTPEKKEELIPEVIVGKIEVKRGSVIKGSEYIYKIKVENLSNSVITDLRIIITSYPDDSLHLSSPEIQKRAKLAPGEMVSPTFKLSPTEDCIVGNINAIVTYLNAKGEPNQITVEPLIIRLICGLLTPHSIKAEEFEQIVKKLINYSNAGEDIELPHNAKTIYEKAKQIIPHKNFHLISSEDHLVVSNFIGILKGFAAGQFSHKKVGLQITISGKENEDACVARIDGYTEDSSMLAPLLHEIKTEIKCWNCEQCGAQLTDPQIRQILDGKIVRCKFCEEILHL